MLTPTLVTISRVWVAATLPVSGGLLVAASEQRWGGACPWIGDQGTRVCEQRQDHLYDFLPPVEPWLPVGSAAQLAGASLLVLALALLPLPWAVTDRRPGPVFATAHVVAVLSVAVVGQAALRSGLDGVAVSPVGSGVTIWLWSLVPPFLLGTLAMRARGRTCTVAAVLLVLASPLVAAFSYAVGSFDAQPWWEAVPGLLTCAAGLCVLVAAIRRPARRRAAEAVPATAS